MGQWPSADLKPPAPGRGRIADAAWWLLFALLAVAIAGGVWRGVHDFIHPTGFDRVGLSVVADRSCVRVTPESRLARALWPSSIDEIDGGCIVAVGGAVVAGSAAKDGVADLLDGPTGSRVEVVIADAKGARGTAAFPRVKTGGWYDAFAILLDSAVALLYAGAALLLRLRRRNDPVARRMSLAFVLIAHICYGPVAFWAWAEVSIPYLMGLAGFLLMTVTLPAYPDGHYVPPATRWIRFIVPAATLAVFVLGTAGVHGLIDGFMKSMLGLVAIGVALLLLRYRRMPAGLAKQQVKWAVFGICAGLLLIIVSAQIPKPPALAVANPGLFEWFTNITITLNQIGYGLIPAGVAVSLMQYRLNDADAAVSKSLGYAIVTLTVGMVWAVIQTVVGDFAKRWSGDPMATAAITTAVAALVFTPARAYVLSWTEAKFQPALVRLRKVPEKLVSWQRGRTPDELAAAVLSELVPGVGAAYAAILGDDGRQWRVLAAQGVTAEQVQAQLELDRPADRRGDPFPVRLELADQVGESDLLAIGPRSDGATFTRDEKSAMAMLVGPLSIALQASAMRERRNIAVEQSLVGIDQRLGLIEQGLSPNRR